MDWCGKSKGSPRAGRQWAHAQGGWALGGKSLACAGDHKTAMAGSLFSLLSSYVKAGPSLLPQTQHQSLTTTPTPGPKRLRSARSSRPEVAPATQRSGWGKEVPLTYRFQDCFKILENSGREAGSLRGCEETTRFSSLSLTNLPKPSGKASPSGQPAFS